MEDSLAKKVERYIRSRHQKKHRTQLLRCLALLVAFATVYALIVPAVTLSNETVCGMEAHVHDESCWSVELASPQPQLVCGAGKSGEILIHTHDSYCYDDMGNLICELPEREFHSHSDACYQEIKEYTCTEVQDLGHTHDASCFAYDKGELICGLEEGQGAHTHTDACYPTERVDEPVCGMEEAVEGNPEGKPPHTHDESCYIVVVRQRLKCGLEECDPVLDEEGNVLQEGHHHDSSCYMTDDELRICGQQEAQGHVHVRECWEWTQRQICTEEERAPGHIHTEECYVISRVLACEKQELVCHTHEAACYDENGVLICTLPEVGLHQHTSECRYVPEGGPEEVRTLICGKEEHIHTDACYMEIHPEQTKYYCGLDEHIHGSECYFESGSLYCTLTEHMHTAECLEEPLPAESEPPQESDDPAPSETPEPPKGVMLEDYTYVYENDAFTVTYHISGFALLPEQAQPDPEPSGEPEPATTDDPSQTADPEPANTDDVPQTTDDPEPVPTDGEPQTPEPDPEPTQDVGQPQEGGGLGEVELDEGGYVEIPLAARPGLRRMASYSGGADSSGPPEIELEPDGAGSVTDPGGDAVSDSAPMPTADTELDPALVEFNVEELVEGTPEYEEFVADDQPEDGVDGEEIIRFNPLELNASYMGQELDLSQCTMTVEYRPTQQLIEQLGSVGSGIMTIDDPEDGDGTPDGDAASEEDAVVMRIVGEGGEELGCAELTSIESCLTVTNMRANAPARTSLENRANPPFTVQYYAYLSTAKNEGGSGTELDLIDTTGKNLPKNVKADPEKNTPPLKHLYLEKDPEGKNYSVQREENVQEIFRTHKFKYASAPGMKYFNIVTGGQIQGGMDGSHYDLDEIWVLKEGKSEDSVNREDWVIYNDSTAAVAGLKKVDDYQVTNRAATADADSSFILIKENTVIRLVYKAKEAGNQGYDGRFFDYDITGGKNTSGQYLTSEHGINNYNNNVNGATGSGVHYAFGNANTGVKYRGDEWTRDGYSNRINQYNRQGTWNNQIPTVYAGCTFGLVNGIAANGNVTFSPGIQGPDLFSPQEFAGKKAYDGTLTFDRQGDTHTLKLVSSAAGSAGDLHKFSHPGKYDGTNGNKAIWSNNFWPMDDAQGTDPKFGKTLPQYSGYNASGAFTATDDGKDHNNYFGMTFSINFEVTENYTGPLEYYFFGDDDMWVFLTNLETGERNLVCDIGGVHPSVGEYVDLWDWVSQTKQTNPKDMTTSNSTSDTENAINADAKVHKYRLDFFYTERGASGSTCWMQFTLPQVAGNGLSQILEQSNSLSITKAVVDLATGDKFDYSQKFKFRLELTDSNGKPISSQDFGAYRSNRSGQVEKYEVTELVESGAHVFELGHDESLVIVGLPAGAKYRIVELAESQVGFDTAVDVYRKPLAASEWTEVTDAADDEKTKDVDESVTVADEEEGTVTKGEIPNGTATKVDYTNRTSYELPSTGSAGAWYTMAGLPLTLAALCVWYKKKPHGKGAVR